VGKDRIEKILMVSKLNFLNGIQPLLAPLGPHILNQESAMKAIGCLVSNER
jgi:hypothetical protein